MIATEVISCTASVATAIIAGMALYAWKREFVGKKKIELAAEIMRAVYDIKDLYIGVRMPIITKVEHDEALEWIKAETATHPGNADVYPERVNHLVSHQSHILENNDNVLLAVENDVAFAQAVYASTISFSSMSFIYISPNLGCMYDLYSLPSEYCVLGFL